MPGCRDENNKGFVDGFVDGIFPGKQSEPRVSLGHLEYGQMGKNNLAEQKNKEGRCHVFTCRGAVCVMLSCSSSHI